MRALACTLAVLVVLLAVAAVEAKAAPAVVDIPLKHGVTMVAASDGHDIAYGIDGPHHILYALSLSSGEIVMETQLSLTPRGLVVRPSDGAAIISGSISDGSGCIIAITTDGTSAGMNCVEHAVDALAMDDAGTRGIVLIPSVMELAVFDTDSLAFTAGYRYDETPAVMAPGIASSRAALAFSHADASGAEHWLVRVMDTETGDPVFELPVPGAVKAIAMDKDASVLLVTTSNSLLHVDLSTAKAVEIASNQSGPSGVYSVSINSSTGVAVVGARDEAFVLHMGAGAFAGLIAPSKPTPHYYATAVEQHGNFALLGSKRGMQVIALDNPVPAIVSLVPDRARAGHGVRVTIQGKRFILSSQARFDSLGVSTEFVGNETLIANVPAELMQEPHVASVTVFNPPPSGGQSAPYAFDVLNYPPVVHGVAPDTLIAGEEQLIAITGQYFERGAQVSLNGIQLTGEYLSESRIDALVPTDLFSAAGRYPLIVTNPGLQGSNVFMLTVLDPAPRIDGFSPSSGAPGALVTIAGQRFTPAPLSVYFNGAQAVVTSATHKSITAIVPLNATSGPISIANAFRNTTSADSFEVTRLQGFELTVAPASVTIPHGGSASVVVMAHNTGPESFTGYADLFVDGLPDGVEAAFNPPRVTAGQHSMMTLNVKAGDPLTATLTIRASASIEGLVVSASAPVVLTTLEAGRTTVTGKVVSSDDAIPLVGVKLTLGDITADTDEAGNFFMTDVPVGDQLIVIDGHTANSATARYPSAIPIPVTIVPGVDNKLPYFIYLHAVSERFTMIDPELDTFVVDSEVPLFEMFIPKGVQIIGHDGLPNEMISVRKVEPDRMPIPQPPDGVDFGDVYMFYFNKPGGGLPTEPIPVRAPNTSNLPPGTQIDLFYYDEDPFLNPDSHQWKTFGTGTVTADGLQIMTDPGVGIPKFCCGAFAYMAAANDERPDKDDCGSGINKKSAGDPVDIATGFFSLTETDLVVPGRVPLEYSRTHGARLRVGIDSSLFGPDNNNFDVRLKFSRGMVEYIMPNASRYTFHQNEYRYTVTFSSGGTRTCSQMGCSTTGRTTRTITRNTYGGAYFSAAPDVFPYENALQRVNGLWQVVFLGGTVEYFNAQGRLVKREDTNGNAIMIERPDGVHIWRISTSSTPDALRFEYSGNLISRITDWTGRSVQYFYDTFSMGRLVRVIDPEGNETNYSYSGPNIQKITDARGNIKVTNHYDGNGRMNHQVFPDGGELHLRYFNPFTPIRASEPLLTPDSFERPADCRDRTYYVREGEQSPADACAAIYLNIPTDTPLRAGIANEVNHLPFEQIQSNARVRVSSTLVVDQNGNMSTWRQNAKGVFLDIAEASGSSRHITRTPWNMLPTSITDHLGRTRAFTYQSFDPVTAPDNLYQSLAARYGAVQTYNPAYVPDATGNVTAVTDALGNVTRYEYDMSVNKVSAFIDPLGAETVLTYDERGNVLSVTDPTGVSASFTYDAHGNMLNATAPDGTVTSFAYDERSNLTSVTDQLGNRTRYRYDELNRVTEAIDPMGNRTRYAYDRLNRITGVTGPSGGVTSLAYDPNGNLTSVTDPRGSTTAYTYDAMNRVETVTDPTGGVTSYAYDFRGNVTSVTDRMGRLTLMWYDNRDRLIRTEYSGGTVVKLYRDAGGRLTEAVETGPEGMSRVTMAYDALDRLTRETTDAGSVEYSYDPAGRITEMRVSGQSPVSYGYDAAGRLTSIETTVDGAPERTSILYDSAGRRERVERPSGLVTAYAYNAAGQLTGVVHFGMDGLTVIDGVAYEYDAAGRRSLRERIQSDPLRDGLIVSAEYDEANRMTDMDGYTFTHDAEGRLTGIDGPCGLTTLAWDVHGRLVGMEGYDSACAPLVASFRYDVFGRRTGRTVNGVEHGYVYSGADVVGQYVDGAYRSRYVRTLNIDEPLARYGTDGTERHFHQDGLMSVLALTDGDGAVTTRYAYSPFGETASYGEADDQPFRFTGREWDGETGLYYYRERYMSPTCKRFISEDPIGFAGGMNFYAYVGNDPVNYVDPWGESPYGAIVKLLKNGRKRVTGILSDKRAAQRARARGENVELPSRQRAGELERANSEGGEVMRHDGHLLPDGSTGRPHYQTPGKRGHSFWVIFGLLWPYIDPFDASDSIAPDPPHSMPLQKCH